VRIVAGTLGGRRIAGPPGRSRAVRPTSDRAREAIFAMLGDVSGLRVLDLFCGSGALALEAISRGAAAATLVDTDAELARRNVAALGVSARCRVVRADALAYLRRPGPRFDLIFCDPPYRLAHRLEGELSKLLPGRLEAEGRVIVESSARRPLALAWPPARERRYGEALIRIYEGGVAG